MTISLELLTAYKESLLPYAARAADRVHGMGCRFAYYTTAETALHILRNREIWMRNTMVMNDFSEVEHGLSCVFEAYRSDAGNKLKKALDDEYPGLSAEFEKQFDSLIPVFRTDTFVTCLSEHPPDEDKHGRLSMWRAYGGIAGVALVLNGDVLFQPSDALAAYSSPVAYMHANSFNKELDDVATNLTASGNVLKTIGREGAKQAVFNMLRFAAVCTKHPAFAEEREWRVVASPALESSPLLPVDVETIGGIPQKILKIKLKNHPDKGLVGLEPQELVERVLIGPCEHAEVIGHAMRLALEAAGVTDAAQKVVYTGIPLRGNQR